jgi:hypothetical protein
MYFVRMSASRVILEAKSRSRRRRMKGKGHHRTSNKRNPSEKWLVHLKALCRSTKYVCVWVCVC